MISIDELAEKLGQFNPKVYISNEQNTSIGSAKILFNTPPKFIHNLLYIGELSSLPNYIPPGSHINFLCIKTDPDIQNSVSNLGINLIVLNNCKDIYEAFDAVQDILITSRKLLDDYARLMNTLLDGKGLQRIIEVAYELLHNKLILVDTSPKILAEKKGSNPDVIHYSIRSGIVSKGYTSTDVAIAYLKKGLYGRIKRSTRPFITKEGIYDCRKIFGRIMVEDKMVGYLIVAEVEREFTENDIELTYLLCNILAAEMQKEHYHILTTDDSKERFLIDLLGGAIKEKSEIDNRLNYLGWKIKKNLFILSIYQNSHDPENLFLTYIKNTLENLLTNCKATIYNNYVVVLLSSNKENPISEDAMIKLMEFIKVYKLSAGISNVYHNLEDTTEYYGQSLIAQEIGNIIDADKLFYKFEDYSIYHVIKIISKFSCIKRFCNGRILALRDYDSQYNTSYTQTLYTYLINEKNIGQAAKILNIHRNTMDYRIKKIEEIIDLSFDKPDQLLHFLITFKILELVDRNLLKLE